MVGSKFVGRMLLLAGALLPIAIPKNFLGMLLAEPHSWRLSTKWRRPNRPGSRHTDPARFDMVWIFDINPATNKYIFNRLPQLLLQGDLPNPLPSSGA
jgi:hypothetical protein